MSGAPANLDPPRRGHIDELHMTAFCEHFEPEPRVEPPLGVCPSCVEMGSTWHHLRQCLACGQMGCCDLSPNRHATAHFNASGHPMIRSAQPEDDWWWCYIDDRLYPEPGSLVGDATT